MLHVDRDRTGRRRLAEIAVLQRGGAGPVHAVRVWHADHGGSDDTGALRRLLERRLVR